MPLVHQIISPVLFREVRPGPLPPRQETIIRWVAQFRELFLDRLELRSAEIIDYLHSARMVIRSHFEDTG